MRDSKPTNPKDAIGSSKLPMDLIPETAVAEMATAFLEGALKYGRYNWRMMGVRSSIYYAAMRRHMSKWVNGEDEDKDTHVNHLASVMACCAIILDAEKCGKLNDDRPPRAPASREIDLLAKKVEHLKELFKDHNPHQYTIADVEETPPNQPLSSVYIDGKKLADVVSWAFEFDPEVDRPTLPDPAEISFVIKDGERCKSFEDLMDMIWADHMRTEDGDGGSE